MKSSFLDFRPLVRGISILLIALIATAGRGHSQGANDPPFYGPFSAMFFPDGDGLKKPLVKNDPVLQADSSWSLYAWIKPAEALKMPSLVGGFGDPEEEFSRYLAVSGDRLILWMGKDNSLYGTASFIPGKWHFIAATFDGEKFRDYADGAQVASGKLDLGSVSPVLELAPASLPSPDWRHFGGSIASLTLARSALSIDEVKRLGQKPDDISSLEFEEGSKPWAVQTRVQAGYRAPQDPATLPRSKAPFSPPAMKPLRIEESLRASGEGQWTLAAGWSMIPAPKINADGQPVSQAGFNAGDWLPATIPGTVLTTMIDRGIYPDPDYGLNNLVIPESLAHQDYWYRVEFMIPVTARGQRLTLTFNGVNYAAEVWLNGKKLGGFTGAFLRGKFDVTSLASMSDKNVLAVRVSPPPHPGIAHEQSIKAGPGEHGGIEVIDGPTFSAAEGWDWIPGIRDRNSGLWQDVTLTATGPVDIGDLNVITMLPKADRSEADIEIETPLTNASNDAIDGDLTASFDDVSITKHVHLVPGDSIVR